MKRILFATDYSFSADKAFEYTLEIASHTNAEVVVMHAFRMDDFSHPDMSSESYDMKHDETKSKLEELIAIACKEPRFAGISYKTAIVMGGPVDALKEAVNLYEPDLVVMGTRGESSVTTFFNPSVSKAMLKAVETPVLIVPEESDISNLRNMVLASDYVPVQSSMLDTFKQMCIGLHANLTIVHVGDDVADLTLVESAEGVRLAHYFGEEVKHHFKFVQDDDVVHGLEVFLEQKADAGLLVMINHERHDWLERLLLPSHTKEVIRSSMIPLLVLKDKS